MVLFADPHNLYDAAYPFYIVLRIFGLFPKSFDGPVRNGNFILHHKDKIYFLILLVFFAILGIATLLNQNGGNLSDSNLLNKAWTLNGILCSVVIITCMIYGASKVENCRLFLNLCCDFDLKVSDKKSLLNCSKGVNF